MVTQTLIPVYGNGYIEILTIYGNGAVVVVGVEMGILNKADEVPEKQRIKPTKLPMTIGKLEVIIKINELSTNV